jgi:iron complex transport system ATP-binding protein
VARSIVTGAVLSAKAIHFSAAGRPILGGVDLTVAPGERVGVIGPNGSGKSTLLRCLYAWHAPTSGTVLLDGTDISALPAHRRAQAVAVLAQHTEAGLGLTVGEVVALGRLPHRRAWGRAETDDAAAIDDALALIGLEMWRDRPFGPLSGGEKQQVLFARALAQRPSLLILDEPTNHLDIRWCDRLCLLEAGRIRATGLPDDVLTLDLIGSVYGVHVDIDRDPRTGRPRLSYYLEDRPEGPSS